MALQHQPRLSASEEQYIEEIAQRQSKYSIIMSDNALVFRADPARMGAALKAYSDQPHKYLDTPYSETTGEHRMYSRIHDLIVKCDALGECHTPEE